MAGAFFRKPGQGTTTPGDYAATALNPNGDARPQDFAPGSDANLQVTAATEGYKRLMSMMVPYYKIEPKQSYVNIYGEAVSKYYYQPVMTKCYIERGDEKYNMSEYGLDNSQTIKFFFVREMMEQYGVFPEPGDILLDRERYYEIDNVNENRILFGNEEAHLYNADTFKNSSLNKSGLSLVYELEGHMTRVSKLNLLPYKIQ